MKSQKNLLIAVAILIAIGVIGYFIVSNPKKETISNHNVMSWNTYTNDQYGFEFQYPGDQFVVSPTEEGEGYEIITLFNIKKKGQVLNISTMDKTPKNDLTGCEKELGKIMITGTTISKCVATEPDDRWSAFLPGWKNDFRFYCWFPEKNEMQCDQILSTFRFLEQSKPVPSDWGTYTNTDYGFGLQYPAGDPYLIQDMAEASHTGFIPLCDYGGAAAICYAYGPDLFPGTNFEGAGLAVNIAEDPTTSQVITTPKSCLNLHQKNQGIRVINGISFNTSHSGEGAGGHNSEDYYYTTFAENHCFDLVIRIDSATFENYEPGTIKDFTPEMRDQVLAKLDQILATFKFTK